MMVDTGVLNLHMFTSDVTRTCRISAHLFWLSGTVIKKNSFWLEVEAMPH